MLPANITQLPVVGVPNERADAARNRQRILAAAERLFSRQGVACTSIDAIACEAGVGKGTVFRRFGDRASLALALLESNERTFQEAFLRGPAPLGPGAPPAERLAAFGRALIAHLHQHRELMSAAQAGGRYLSGPYRAYRLHVAVLLHRADPSLDAECIADCLLSPINPDLIAYQLGLGISLDRLSDGWETLAKGALAARSGP